MLLLILDSDIITELEKYYYEYNMKSHIIEHLLERHAEEKEFLNSPLFKKYEESYFEAFFMYNNFRERFNNYIKNELIKDNELYATSFDWTIESFIHNKVRIDFK